MALQTFEGLFHTLQTAAVAVLIFAVCAYIPKFQYKAQLAKLPVFGGSGSGEKQRQTYLTSSKKLYDEGYKKVK